ncbi:hypothetical protein BC833DRAFT_569794 [Globomyces pollinis-pini]|nr:hypothetical protein BC833DRAFT_569794 [Globomyces pollinis-pini]
MLDAIKTKFDASFSGEEIASIYSIFKCLASYPTSNPNADAFSQELPMRYLQSLKLLTHPTLHPDLKTKLQPLVDRYLFDINLLSEIPNHAQVPVAFNDCIRKLHLRHVETSSLFSSLYFQNHSLLTQTFYKQFYGVNISSRFLMEEHLSLVDQGKNLVTLIDPIQLSIDVCTDLRNDYIKKGIDVPEIHILNVCEGKNETLYVQHYLKFILSNLLNHSMATGLKTQKALQPIILEVVTGEEDTSFHISDEFGGLSLSNQSQSFWKLKDQSQENLFQSKLLSNYFGGDIEMISMEGFGNDSYLHLYKNGSLEHFPQDANDGESDWFIKLLKDL